MKCKISAVFAALFLAVILTSCGSKGKNIVPVELWYGATFSEAGDSFFCKSQTIRNLRNYGKQKQAFAVFLFRMSIAVALHQEITHGDCSKIPGVHQHRKKKGTRFQENICNMIQQHS